jgi:hypothetical protein
LASETAHLKPNSIGRTTLTLSDELNPMNTHSLALEVQKVQRIVWLEQQVEAAHNSSEQVDLYPIAIDPSGRKFTNCSALQLNFKIEGSSFELVAQPAASWTQLQAELSSNSNLLQLAKLSQRFLESPDTYYADELQSLEPSASELFIKHNNFGVCSKVTVKSV